MANGNHTVDQANEVCQSLAKMAAQFAAALPPHITPEKFIRVAQTAVRQTPDLVSADRQTLFGACLEAAADGLLPDGREATIVVFNTNVGTKQKPEYIKEAVYTPMTAGILKKVRNSGELSAINAQVVCEKDEYEAWEDEAGPHFKFKKARGDRGKEILTFAYAILKSGAVYFEEMSDSEMDAVKAISRSQSIWNGPFAGEMKRKTAIRRLSKRLPMSTDLEGVIHADDKIFDLPDSSALKGGASPTSTATPRINAIVDNVEPPPPPPGDQSPL